MKDDDAKKDLDRVIAEELAGIDVMNDEDIDHADIPPIRDGSASFEASSTRR